MSAKYLTTRKRRNSWTYWLSQTHTYTATYGLRHVETMTGKRLLACLDWKELSSWIAYMHMHMYRDHHGLKDQHDLSAEVGEATTLRALGQNTSSSSVHELTATAVATRASHDKASDPVSLRQLVGQRGSRRYFIIEVEITPHRKKNAPKLIDANAYSRFRGIILSPHAADCKARCDVHTVGPTKQP